VFKMFKATAIVSLATVINIIVGIVRAKFTAVNLGPAGVGIFAQALNFQQLIITVTSLSIGVGIIKYISKYHAQGEALKIEGIISSAVWMQLMISLASIVFIAAFSILLSGFLFSNKAYWPYLIILSIGIPFSVLASTGESIMFGFGSFKAFTKARGLSAILSLIPLFFFIRIMSIKGSFIYLAVASIITFFIYAYLLYKNIPNGLAQKMLKILFAISPLKGNLKKFGRDLLTYGGASFIAGILNLITIVSLRSFLIRFFGAEANGYYQVVFALSSYHLMFFTNGLWSYFYPNASAIDNMRHYSVELNQTMRFCIFGIIPFIAGIFLFKYAIVHMLFSSKFIYSTGLFSTQLFGDLFFIMLYIMGTSLLASTRLKAYLVSSILYCASSLGFFLLLKDTAGLKAITISYILANIISFAFLLYYHIKNLDFKLYTRNLKLLVSGIIVSAIILFMGVDNFVVYGLKIVLLILWVLLFSTNSEKKTVMNFIRKRSGIIFGYGQ